MKCPSCDRDGFNCYASKAYDGYSIQYRKCNHCGYTEKTIQAMRDDPDFITIDSNEILANLELWHVQ